MYWRYIREGKAHDRMVYPTNQAWRELWQSLDGS